MVNHNHDDNPLNVIGVTIFSEVLFKYLPTYLGTLVLDSTRGNYGDQQHADCITVIISFLRIKH